MGKSKRKRWVCPLCNVGKLGLQRPRKNDVIRYCLPCSEKTGRLVERVSPSDISARKRKEKAKAERKAKASLKPRKTIRDWMKISRYEYVIDGITYNVMLGASVMCRRQGWENPQRLSRLWKRTQMNGSGKQSQTSIITMNGRKRSGSSGWARGDSKITVRLAHSSLSASLVTLLHELCHIDQDSIPIINGKRRPHDLAFNLKQMEMAQRMWGYNVDPEDAGWSVGKGYAPTKDLKYWLHKKIKAKDEKVMKWLEKLVF